MGDDRYTMFLDLHMKHQRAIFNYLLAALHDFQKAEDLLQEITIVLWKKFGDYRQSLPFLPWAFGIARRELARHFRDRGPAEVFLPLSVLDGIASACEEEEKELAEESSALVKCLEKLPPEQRDLVGLRYEKGESLGSIAKMLGQTLSAVNMRLVRIRRALLDCVRRAIGKGVNQ